MSFLEVCSASKADIHLRFHARARAGSVRRQLHPGAQSTLGFKPKPAGTAPACYFQLCCAAAPPAKWCIKLVYSRGSSLSAPLPPSSVLPATISAHFWGLQRLPCAVDAKQCWRCRSSHKSWHQIHTGSGECVLLAGPAHSAAPGNLGGRKGAVGGRLCTTLWLHHYSRHQLRNSAVAVTSSSDFVKLRRLLSAYALLLSFLEATNCLYT